MAVDKVMAKKGLEALKAVMKEYNLSIYFSCGDGSDTEGLYDDHLCIDQGDDTIFESSFWDMDESSI